MTILLGSIALAAIALRALWYRLVGSDPVAAFATAQRVKLGTNLLILGAQTAGYVAELMAGTRSTLPSTTSTTTTAPTSGPTIPSAATFGSRTAGSLSD